MSDTVFILILLVLMMMAGIVIGSIPAAAMVYVWKNVYPIVKRMAKWSARVENLAILGIIDAILFLLVIVAFIAVSPLLIVFILIPLYLLIPIELGILVWLIRFTKRIYGRIRIYLLVTYLKFRIRPGVRRRPPRMSGTPRTRMPRFPGRKKA
jgi:hypothetical protein